MKPIKWAEVVIIYVYILYFSIFTIIINPTLKKYLKRLDLTSALTNQYMQKKVFQVTSYTTKGDGFSLCIHVKINLSCLNIQLLLLKESLTYKVSSGRIQSFNERES